MSEMVERVADALRAQLAEHGPGDIVADMARAAIRAMCDPTPEMIAEGDAECDFFKHATQTWRVMIDAALKPR